MSACPDRTPHVPPRRLVAGVALTAVLGTGLALAPTASAAAPIAAKVAPAAAMPNHGITISGDLLTGTTRVEFLGNPDPLVTVDDRDATIFQVLNPKTLFVQVPEGSVNGPVRVTTPDGTATTPPVTVWRAPKVDALSATVGKGLDVITLTGSFLGGKRKVTIAGKAATLPKLTALPGTDVQTLEVTVPKGLPGGPTSLVFSNEGGSVRTPFYVAPEIKGVAPKAGSTAGGGVAVISGSGFTGATSVTFGGVPSPKVLGMSDKEIVVVVPPGTAGATQVVVRTESADGRAAESAPAALAPYTYQPIPTVASVNPNGVALAGGDVVVTAHNLTVDTVVSFGSAVVTGTLAPVNGTLSTFTFSAPPATKAAATKITLMNTVGAVVYKTVTPFAYVAAPTVAKLAPATGPVGSTVVVSGTGFTSDATATFGATAASCTVVSFVALSCVVPAGFGTQDVTVTTVHGPSAAGVPFAYGPGPVLAPVVKKLVPPTGLAGSTVSINGGNLHLVEKVSFPRLGGGLVDAPDFLVVAAGRLVVRVPEGATNGALVLTPSAGRKPVTSGAVRFVAVEKPSVTSVDAVGISTLGVNPGDTVVLRGRGLRAGAVLPVVTIDGLPAAVLKTPVPTPSAVAVKVPAGIGKQAPVVVTTPFGTTTAPAQAYYAPQVMGAKTAAVFPDGSTAYTITGLGFTGAHAYTQGSGRLSAVTFGGVPATQVVVLSDKLIVAVAPDGSSIADDLVVSTQHGPVVGNSDSVTRPLVLPLPAVTTMTPDVATLGETPPQVTLTGTNLSSETIVEFGGAAATFVSAAADGSSIVVAPPVRTSTASVAVTLTNVVNDHPYAVTAPGPFRYVPVPSIASITPAAGFTGRQQPDVVISGKNLRLSSVVRFGAVAAAVKSAAADGSSITVVPPVSNDALAVDISVTNLVDAEPYTATSVGGYAYSLAVATVGGLSSSTALPGTVVAVTGTSFVGVTSVRFGATEIPFTAIDTRTLYATVPVTPSGLYGSTVAVSVTNATGTASTVTKPWTWSNRPILVGMGVKAGAHNDTVRLTGAGFTAASAVRFGSIPATFTVVSDTAIDVKVPASPSSGTLANVTVVARTLTSPEPLDESANDWSWAPVAAVNAVTPEQIVAGGLVTVTGRNFTPGQTVWIQVDAATELAVTPTVVSSTEFTFIAPAKPAVNARGQKYLYVQNSSGTVSTVDVGGSNGLYWQL